MKILAIAKVTFYGIIRDKILYNVFFGALFLLIFSYLVSQVSFVRPERILLDFGLAVIALSCYFIALLIGASMLSKEIQDRTVYIALSRPVSRFEFIVGKICGLFGVLCANWIIFSSVFLLFILLMGTSVSVTLLWALFFILLQSFIVAATTVLFSTFSTPSLSVVMSFGIFIIGKNLEQLRTLTEKIPSFALKKIAEFIALVIPDLGSLDLGTKVTYELPISMGYAFYAIIYSLAVIGILVFFSTLILNRKTF